MKYVKKITTILFAALLLCSCAVKQDIELKDSSYYLEQLENYTPREKNKNKTKDYEKFLDFEDSVFHEYLEHDYIEMRSYIVDYENYGVIKPAVGWGTLEYQNYSDAEFYNDILVKLREIRFKKLSYTQQFEYEKLEYYLLEKICECYYKEYGPLFSISNDLLGYMFFNLDELPFDTEEYVTDYFELLHDFPRYMSDALVYTSKQADKGIYTDNESIDYNCDYIVELIGDEEGNDFTNSFNTKIDKLDFISDDKKQEYKKTNEEIVENEIIPCLQNLSEELLKYYDMADTDTAYQCFYSKDYARFMLMLNTSSNADPQTLFDRTLSDLNKIGADYLAIKDDESMVDEKFEILFADGYGGLGLSDTETLDYLEGIIPQIVPALDEYNYEISPLDATNEGSNVIAYHIAPAIDKPDGTIIRTNPLMFGYDQISDYTVVAHEGLPGHMYQNLYYLSTNPADITGIYRYIGYKEGWATYSMLEALELSGIKSEALLTYERLYWMLDYYMCALGDIYYNYMGGTVEEFAKILDDNGWNDEYAETVHDIVRKNPGTNLAYGVGYMQIMSMRTRAEEALGDKFDVVEFHKELLIHGPLPMVVMEKAVDDYIEANK